MIFNRVVQVVLIVCLFFTLSACSSLFGREGYFRDRGDDYLKASEIPPLKVPRKLDSGSISELFVVPPVSNNFVDAEKEFEVPHPNFSVAQEKSQVKIQKLNARRWILVNSEASLVWLRAKNFLVEQGLALSYDDPISGTMETVWLALKDEPNSKDRYRLRIEQGLHTETTEIHLLQMTAASKTPGKGNVNWPSKSVNSAREKWMLDKLAAYLAGENEASVSLRAQSIGRSQKVHFVSPYQGDSFLLVTLDQERVLASVGGALNIQPFKVEESFKGQGYFLTAYDPDYETNSDDDKEAGFFYKLFGSDKRKKIAYKNRLLYYRVDVRSNGLTGEEGAEIKVSIQSASSETLTPVQRDRLLQIIRRNLL